MARYKIICRGCGKHLLTYNQNGSKKYESPIKVCKNCGTKYFDPRCCEIAIEGIPSDTFSIPSYTISMLIGIFMLYRGIHLFHMHELGMPDELQWLLPSILSIFGAIFTVVGLVEIFIILTGIKRRKFDRLIKDSRKRLEDKNYVYMLKSFGYEVPEEYL